MHRALVAWMLKPAERGRQLRDLKAMPHGAVIHSMTLSGIGQAPPTAGVAQLRINGEEQISGNAVPVAIFQELLQDAAKLELPAPRDLAAVEVELDTPRSDGENWGVCVVVEEQAAGATP